jgi:hypothetical protein
MLPIMGRLDTSALCHRKYHRLHVARISQRLWFELKHQPSLYRVRDCRTDTRPCFCVMTMSISASVRQCLARFKYLEEKNAHRTDLEDEHGRFRIWAGNVSAHRSGGRRSLEYRLRDSSNLQSMVVALLQDLLRALEDLQNVLKDGARSLPDGSNETNQVGQESADEDSDDEDDAALFSVVQPDDPDRDPAMRMVEEIREINLCLLRFSMTLRNPARHDQMKESASTSTHHFERFDIDHVRDKFPKADTFLHERLGKGISKHRQYFKYRKDHHSKLTEGLDDEEVSHERPSTIATSLNVPVPEAPMPQGDELETESLYTATSYAQTVGVSLKRCNVLLTSNNFRPLATRLFGHLHCQKPGRMDHHSNVRFASV